jgi:two-component system, OmpR family, sensor histidine kinase KdpD
MPPPSPDAVLARLKEHDQEDVPDTLLERADEVINVEVTAEELRNRLREGKIHKPQKVEQPLIPERVMVCMSSNVLARRVVRMGARIAGQLGARWYAVYVETPAELPGRIGVEDSDALRENIQLAESLGGAVVRVKAARPAEGLIAFAQREGITHVIFGQSARSRWELLWRGSTIDQFLTTVRDAAVQVVPLDERS